MQALLAENARLQMRLEEAESMLLAIRTGDIDGLIIQGTQGPQVFALQGADAENNRVRGEMLAQVSDAVIATDRHEQVIYLNAAAERLYGMSSFDALGRGLDEIFETRWENRGDKDLAQESLTRLGTWRGENIHFTHDGRALKVESGISVLKDRDGQSNGTLAVIRDVTDRKLHEQRVLISEIRYRRLFETAHDGVLILDPESGKIIDANPFMTKMLGYSHDQLVGRELFEIGLLKDEVESREMVQILRRAEQVRYDNLPLKSEDGQHHEVEVVANLYDEDGRPVIQCNIRDITERKRAEEHVKLLMAEINHRAKNLLAVVQAVAQQTAKYGEPASFAARLSDRIDGLAAGQDLLIRNLWQGVEMRELVEVQLAHFKDLIGERVLIDGPAARLTMGAAQGIGMALHELATNAVKYGALSNNNGKVNINWAFNRAVPRMLSMNWLESGGPKVAPPTRKGFGQIVTGRMAEATVDGKVEILYREQGLSWKLSAPAENALAQIGDGALVMMSEDGR